MPRSYLDPPLPIAALATPAGSSALAVIRATGDGCIELLASVFSRPRALTEAPGHSLVHGKVMDAASNAGKPEIIDEVLVSVFRAPRSPTGEDQVEISCHGSPVVVRRLLSCLHAAGFAPALPGEFSFRAFTKGKGDLVKAEAVNELIAARSEGARVEALRRLEGGLSRRLEGARAGLLGLLAEAEVRLDYAEEDGSPATLFPKAQLLALRGELSVLVDSWKAGRIFGEGATVVLAGRANAGKSSLFNLLLREERALVSPEAGTTRDWIEAGIEVGGFPVRLIDTAGLREATGGVEAQGIERSRSLITGCDLVCCLVDATLGLAPEDEELLALRPDALCLWTKVDLATASPCPATWLPLSARTGQGFQGLVTGIEMALRGRAGLAGNSVPVATAGTISSSMLPQSMRSRGEEVIANLRQKGLLERSVAALDSALAILEATGGGSASPGSEAGTETGSGMLDAAALDLRDAADALGEITGEIGSPEVLEAIFSGFCLGK